MKHNPLANLQSFNTASIYEGNKTTKINSYKLKDLFLSNISFSGAPAYKYDYKTGNFVPSKQSDEYDSNIPSHKGGVRTVSLDEDKKNIQHKPNNEEYKLSARIKHLQVQKHQSIIQYKKLKEEGGTLQELLEAENIIRDLNNSLISSYTSKIRMEERKLFK